MISAQQVVINSGMNASMSASIMSDAMSEPSSPESTTFDDSDLIAVHDDVTAQLVNAGTIGVAAAAAIATGKRRKRPHSFETNPSVRKRQQTRLLRKLRATIDEYTTRVGQQAVVLTCTPGKTQQIHAYRVFGSQPLENVMRGRRGDIMGDLEGALVHQAPPPQRVNNALHELPPLVIDGIPTSVDKMTQAQLRAFIPEMLKYSTGRSKPGWGKPECRPPWWPDDVPWANVRSDVRSEDQKKKVSWTHALRTIVRNCYKHHCRDDLLPDFHDEMVPQQHVGGGGATVHAGQFSHQTMVQTINNPDGSISVIQIDTGDGGNPQVVTLADGTQATVVHTIPNGLHHPGHHHEANQAVHTLADVAANHHDMTGGHAVSVEVNEGSGHGGHTVATLTEGTINQDGQLVLTGDHTIAGMVTIPVSMYQTVMTGLANLGDSQSGGLGMSAGTIQVIAPHSGASTLPHGVQVITPGHAAQLVSVESLQHQHQHVHGHHAVTIGDAMTMTTSAEESESQEGEDIKPLFTTHVSAGGDVPDATQAVEVMSVDQQS